MEQCWSGEPSRRPLLGAILPVLEAIQKKAKQGKLEEFDDFKLDECKSSDCKNNALALLEPNNQRGQVPIPSFQQKRKPFKSLKHTLFPTTNVFHTSACSNFYIQMHEF